jgi:hypothetical protein
LVWFKLLLGNYAVQPVRQIAALFLPKKEQTQMATKPTTDAEKVIKFREIAKDKTLPQDVRNTYLDKANELELKAFSGEKMARGGAVKKMAKGGVVKKGKK